MTRTPILRIAAAALLAGTTAANAQSGDVLLYTSQPNELLAEMIAEFNATYPDVSVEVFRSGTTEVMNKLKAEIEAGDPQPDLLFIANALDMSELDSMDMLLHYADAPVDAYDPAIVGPDGAYFGTKLITTGIIYNTDLVETPPTSWSDLTADPANGAVIMPSPLYSGAAALHVGTMTANDAFGWAYYEALADNGAVAGRGNGSVLEAVATGQFAYGIIVDFMAFNARNEGSPVDFVFPTDGVTAITEPVAIMANTDNAEAAKAFVDWQLSLDGQGFAGAQGYLPAHPKAEAAAWFPSSADIEIIAADPAVLLESAEDVKVQFADLFGG